MGLPTIATNWSGLTAFMSNDVALPIPVRTMDDYIDDDVGGEQGGVDELSFSRTQTRAVMLECTTHT